MGATVTKIDKVDDTFLSAEDLLSASPEVKYKKIPVWGKNVWIQLVTAEDILIWNELNEGPAKRTAGARLMVRSIVKSPEEPVQLLTEDAIPTLLKKDHASSEKIIKEILTFNGMVVAKEKEAKND